MYKLKRYSLESLFHTFLHFVVLIVMFWILIYSPYWVSVLAMAVWILQFKIIGSCFLTIFAHKRKVMLGMSYWQYVPFLFGIKDYKKAGLIIDTVLKLIIIGILCFRGLLVFY